MVNNNDTILVVEKIVNEICCSISQLSDKYISYVYSSNVRKLSIRTI